MTTVRAILNTSLRIRQILSKYAWQLQTTGGVGAGPEELARVSALLSKVGENPNLQRDGYSICLSSLVPRMQVFHGHFPHTLTDGQLLTEAMILDGLILTRDEWLPLSRQSRDQSVGARRDFFDFLSRFAAGMICRCVCGSHEISTPAHDLTFQAAADPTS